MDINKKIATMKKLSTGLLSAGIFLLAACNGNSSNDSVAKADSTNNAKDTSAMTSSQDSTGTTASNAPNHDAADFAVKAANANMTEIQLGDYAAKHATDHAVRSYADMLVKDHTAANDKLKTIAASENITLPATVSNDNMNTINDLMKKTGKDFDKSYMNQMVSDHKDAISMFQKASDNLQDSVLKQYAYTTLPKLHEHLQKAEAIVKSHSY